MPELPEVETIKRDLDRLIVGRKISEITTDSPKQVQPSLAEVKKAIVGTKIKKIRRRAKVLQIFLSNGQILVVHLKLTGRLLVRKEGTPKDDWQHVTISLSGKKELRFADLRKFGWIRLLKNQELRIMNHEFGIEPLTPAFKFEKFFQVIRSSSRPVKIILMDQKRIAGIGNIYANDALFLAKIDPRRPANKVTEKEASKLFKAIEKVLRAGIKYRGASDQYYLDALGRKGAYQDHFLTYGRQGKKCFDCQGKIKKIKLGGRGTFFCPACQR
jgi:formamidopyrimidine-DNA glycosylase